MKNIDRFANVKHGREAPDYLHETLKPILEETYGVIVYQEQVMQIAQVLSGYSLGEADLLRRAMGKKQPAEMAKQKSRFIEPRRALAKPRVAHLRSSKDSPASISANHRRTPWSRIKLDI
jgi:DNA polymerase III alpha subunit